MQLRFRDIAGRTEVIEISPASRMTDVVNVVASRYGIPAGSLQLSQSGRVLPSSASVSDLQIDPDETIFVYSGGPPRPSSSPGQRPPRIAVERPPAPPQPTEGEAGRLRQWLLQDPGRFVQMLSHISATKPGLATAIGNDPLPFLHQLGVRGTFQNHVLSIHQ